MTLPESPRRLVNTGIRVDADLRDEFVALLKREDPENDFSSEIRRMMRRRVEEAKARENERAA
jgi:hypothetical protein